MASDKDKQVTREMLADITWLGQQLSSMRGEFNRVFTKEFIGRSKEFACGVLWERARAAREKAAKESGAW